MRESSEERNEAGSDSFSQAGRRRFPIRRRGSRRIPVRRRGSRRIPSAAEAQEGPPPRPLPPTTKEETSTKDPLLTTMGTNPPPAGKSQPPSKNTPPIGTNPPRRSRCRRKGCPSPHEASFAWRETRQKGRRVSAVALFSAPLRKTLFFFVGGVAPFLSVIIIITLAVS